MTDTNAANDSEQSVVYVVDDDPLVLQSVADALRLDGHQPKTFSNAAAFLQSVRPHDVGCVVTDLRMPAMDGVQLQQALIERSSNLSLIVLTAFATVEVAVQVMKSGATTLLEKPVGVSELCSQVAKAIRNSQQNTRKREDKLEARRKLETLTAEELAVLDCACEGKANRVIGQELSLSNRTVDRRRQSALKKLSVDSIAAFAIIRSEAQYPNQGNSDRRNPDR